MGKYATTPEEAYAPELEKDMAQRLYELKEKKNHTVFATIFLTSAVWATAGMFLINHLVGICK